ncbi:RagB/SusD family nutrient uptake outer membrane protein [Leadbetterella byssophila]
MFFGVLIEKSWFSHNATGDTNKHLFPIPTVELNKNNKLKQNPGY